MAGGNQRQTIGQVHQGGRHGSSDFGGAVGRGGLCRRRLVGPGLSALGSSHAGPA